HGDELSVLVPDLGHAELGAEHAGHRSGLLAGQFVAHVHHPQSLISMLTSAGRSRRMSESTAFGVGSTMSIRRLCVRISKCSRESLYLWGERITQNTFFSVGSGTGPTTVAPALETVSTILRAEGSITSWSYDLSRMRIVCPAMASCLSSRLAWMQPTPTPEDGRVGLRGAHSPAFGRRGSAASASLPSSMRDQRRWRSSHPRDGPHPVIIRRECWTHGERNRACRPAQTTRTVCQSPRQTTRQARVHPITSGVPGPSGVPSERIDRRPVRASGPSPGDHLSEPRPTPPCSWRWKIA